MRISLARRHWFSSVVAAAGMVVGVAVVQVATTGPAAALPGLTTVSSTRSAVAAPWVVQDVDCPAGTVVLGGGGQITGFRSDKVILTESEPLSSRTWRAGAQEVFPGWDGAWGLTVFAVCARLPGGGGWELRTGDSGSGTGTFKTSFTFDCPSGKKAFGAGGRIDTGNGTVGLVMIRPDDALSKGRASARRTGSGPDGAWSVTSYVVCAFPVPGQQYTGKITPNSSTSLVTCPGSTKTNGIGGGGGLVDLGAVFLQTMAPNGDRGVAVEMTGVQNGGAMVQATCSD